jgi:hypothetical protein
VERALGRPHGDLITRKTQVVVGCKTYHLASPYPKRATLSSFHQTRQASMLVIVTDAAQRTFHPSLAWHAITQ